MYKKLWRLLGAEAKKDVIYLVVGFFIMGLVEIAGIASILPFFGVALDPEIIQTNKYLNYFFVLFEFTDASSFILFLAFIALSILVFGNLFFIYVNWKIINFSRLQEHYISKRLLSSYLNKPYEYFLTNSSHTLEKNIILETNRLVSDLIAPGMAALAKIFVVFFIVVFLIFINPLVAFIVLSSLLFFYIIIYLIVNSFLDDVSDDVSEMLNNRNKIISDAFSNIREVILRSSQQAFVTEYSCISYKHEKALVKVLAIGSLPRYLFEILAFGSILAITAFYISNNDYSKITYIALYAFSGYRLLPAIQQIYFAIIKYKYAKSALNIIYRDMVFDVNKVSKVKEKRKKLNTSERSILKLKKLYYKYPHTNNNILVDISLDISRGIVGIAGQSGSGKSTLMDIFMGLIPPSSGEVSIYNSLLTEEILTDWQNKVSYVSQDVHLTNESIINNIAFKAEKLNKKRIIEVCKLVNLHDFIITLKDSYETILHENGSNLSGGQRQRIGIARALYNNSKVLVMDEATSALDSINEKEVLNNIIKNNYADLIIVSSHNISTLERCNEIVLLQKGSIVDTGSFNYLLDRHKLFSDLVSSDLT